MNIQAMFPDFGKHISKEEGDILFKKARELEDQSLDLLNKAFINNPEMVEYYIKQSLGFIFSKENLQELLAKMTTNDHYLVLLTGAKENNKRTLMAFVYKTCEEDICLDTTEITGFAGKVGTQHPGLLKKVEDKNVVPERIKMSDLEV